MENNIPKVSVVIPVYNVEQYLQQCIDSLLSQTLQDIELIFVNDASTDHSLEILERNAQRNPIRMKVIDSKENLCQGGARNLGIKAARGTYIGFVDSDDFVHPDMFRVLYDRALETGADVTFIQYTAIAESVKYADNAKEVWGGGAKPLFQWHEKLMALNLMPLDDCGRMDMMCYPIGGVCCGLWTKELIFRSNTFFPEHLKYEDNFWVSMIKCYISKAAFIPRVMYFYRSNPSSTVHGRNQEYQFDRIKIENSLLDEAKERGFFEKYYSGWEFVYTTRYVFNTYYIFLNSFDKMPLEQMRMLTNDLKTKFPNWRKNRYFKELSKKTRLKHILISKFPIQYAKFYKCIKRN